MQVRAELNQEGHILANLIRVPMRRAGMRTQPTMTLGSHSPIPDSAVPQECMSEVKARWRLISTSKRCGISVGPVGRLLRGISAL